MGALVARASALMVGVEEPAHWKGGGGGGAGGGQTQ